MWLEISVKSRRLIKQLARFADYYRKANDESKRFLV